MGLGGRPRLRLRGLCIGITASRARASSASIIHANKTGFSSDEGHESSRDNAGDSGGETGGGNRVMVVVDSSFEAKGALDWALSHTIQREDSVVLVHVAKPTREDRFLPEKVQFKGLSTSP
ncbi:hypothetical protein PIB30_050151 [Stylosanthes scabra]|uniref:UspA domain-containing protein n=1 Tax=Stylosanthes scabra TaxID=79078 RepID=A0ABU6YJC7_9FABA|nr:hypothetical protein [Stylosanthes scabra]